MQGVWTYDSWDLDLGTLHHQKWCDVDIPGGEYKKIGTNCSEMAYDGNQSNKLISSCVTRPDHNGVRKIWAVHAARPLGQDCPAVLQWYEINPATQTLVEASRYPLEGDDWTDGDWAHDASIAVNANGDKVISFNRSYADTTKYPGIWRLTVPYGRQPVLTEEKAGPPLVYRPGPFNFFWADFSGVEPDPVMDCQFWGHHITVHNNPVDPPCDTISEQWRSWLLRYRVCCGCGPTTDIRENLDMDFDGELTAADVAIFAGMVGDEDPGADRTYEGQTDAFDYLDFMAEWEEPG